MSSDSENVLKLLSELMQVVTELSSTLASHTHQSPEISGPTSKPNQSGAIKGYGSVLTELKKRLDPSQNSFKTIY
ncbi:hypothetical protein ACN08P_17325 [Photobacterium leiognathi subsp. mandapamensis]|uniref:hypothetical protein n=1 Tax=Photobacterium leiognathi TaxID=553611 RepID=UPI003AF35A25